MKRENVNYLAAGLLVLSAIALLIAVLFQMTGRTGGTETYYVQLGSVSGIRYGTPVYYEGFRVGQVEDVRPSREGTTLRFRVALAVDEDWPIPRDAIASAATAGLLSDVFINIEHSETEELLEPGGELPTRASADIFLAMSELAVDLSTFTEQTLTPFVDDLGSQVRGLTGDIESELPGIIDRFNGILDGASTFLDSANDVLNPSTRDELKGMVGNLTRATEQIRILSEDIHDTRLQLDRLLGGAGDMVEANRPHVDALIQEMRVAVYELGQSMNRISNNLEASTRNLELFSEQIREQPNRLLFSPEGREDEL